MKKIIAFILCGASLCFGLGMPFTLKPNVSMLSQSWNSLSYINKATLFIKASIISFAAIIYILWPDSEESAWRKANPEFLSRQKKIEDQMRNQKSSPEQIKKNFEKRNPAIFPFGSWWNRNAFHVTVEIQTTENPRTKREETILTLALKNVNTKQGKYYEYSLATQDFPWHSVIFRDHIQNHPNNSKSN